MTVSATLRTSTAIRTTTGSAARPALGGACRSERSTAGRALGSSVRSSSHRRSRFVDCGRVGVPCSVNVCRLRFRSSGRADRPAGRAARRRRGCSCSIARPARVAHGAIARSARRCLRAGDLLVVNDTRVFPARLLGHRVPSGGAVECLLLSSRGQPSVPTPAPRIPDPDRPDPDWDALMHPGQKLKPARSCGSKGPPAC